jgi:hypothetical protein
LAALLDGIVVDPPHLALDRGHAYDDCREVALARG